MARDLMNDMLPGDHDSSSLLANALHFLLADGRVDDREISLLNQLASRLKGAELTRSDWARLATHVESQVVTDHTTARHCLAECYGMMLADDEVHAAERRAWIQLAVWFGVTADVARNTLSSLEDNVSRESGTPIIEQALRLIDPEIFRH